jgi:cobalt transporter subunit CbtB
VERQKRIEMTTKVQSSRIAAAGLSSRTKVLLQAGSLLLAGALLVFFSGFAQSEALHDAAHDTRHALSFPCH